MKQQLIVRFIVYMIFTIIFTSFYYVIGPEKQNNDTYGNFQPFPDILPGNIGDNEISDDLYAANVHTCKQGKNSCANGYVCKKPGEHLYKLGHKLNPSLDYCIPANLPTNLACNTFVGKYEWAEDGGVDSMQCKSIYPNLYDAAEQDPDIINTYPCNINVANSMSALSVKNNLMNTQSMIVETPPTPTGYTIYPPYSITWSPFNQNNSQKVDSSMLSKFNPYSTVCSWYNQLKAPTTVDSATGDGVEIFGKFSISDNTTPTGLLFSQNKKMCDVYDPYSYKCFSYTDSECIEQSDICQIAVDPSGISYCKPKLSKIVKNENDCTPSAVAIPLNSQGTTSTDNVYYCGPKQLGPSTNRPSYLQVLPKLRAPSGEKIKKKPLWNCRCLSAPTGDTYDQYCAQLSQDQCNAEDICAPTTTPTCVRSPDIIVAENSILYPESLYTCNYQRCTAAGNEITSTTGEATGNQSLFNIWNPCTMTNSEYDCTNKQFISSREKSHQCQWDSTTQQCTMPFVTPSGVYGLWNDNMMTKYWCEFYGYRWLDCNGPSCSNLPQSYQDILSGAPSTPPSMPPSQRGSPSLFGIIQKVGGICMNEGYSCSCHDASESTGGLMKSNIDGICYKSTCGYISQTPSSMSASGDDQYGRSFTTAPILNSNPMEPYCMCGGGVNDVENAAVYCNSDLISNEEICSNYQDYDSCEGMTGKWCKWNRDTPSGPNTAPSPRCRTLCQNETHKAGCEQHGIERCVWKGSSPSEGLCMFPDCKPGLGRTTGQYCIDDCLPSTCNNSICSLNTAQADKPASISCSKATLASAGPTASGYMTGECVPEYGATGLPYGDPALSQTYNDSSLDQWVHRKNLVGGADNQIIRSNTFCQSTGLGMSQPVHKSFMSFYADNPYYNPAMSDITTAKQWGNTNTQNEIDTEKHKMGCAKGFKPVKWNTQVESNYSYCQGLNNSKYGKIDDLNQYNTACSINATTFDPSQVLTTSTHSYGDTFGSQTVKPGGDYRYSSLANSNMALTDYYNLVTGKNTSMSWSGQTQSPTGSWGSYSNLKNPTLNPAKNMQQCSQMGKDGGSCRNMNATEESRVWYSQDDTFGLTGLYGVPQTQAYKAGGGEWSNDQGDDAAPLVHIGVANKVGTYNLPDYDWGGNT